jgi:hypothetical protein
VLARGSPSQPRSTTQAIAERAAVRIAAVFDTMAQRSQDAGERDVALQLYSRAVQVCACVCAYACACV